MNAFIAIVQKELRSVLRERTMIIAILIQLFIASFSSALLMGLMSVYDPDAANLSAQLRVRVGIVGDEQSPLVGFLTAHHARITFYDTLEEVDAAFQEGIIETALVIPEPGPGTGTEAATVQLYLPPSETHATLIRMVLNKPLKQYENLLRERNGIWLNYQDVTGESSLTYEFQYAVMLPLLMFFPAFVTGSMVVDIICEEIANRTLDTLWSAPLSLNTILGAKIFATLVLAGGQCCLWMLLLRFNGMIVQRWGLILLLATLSATLIGIAGAAMALAFKDRERTQFVYSIFILLATGMSYFFDFSPIALTTRLATGDVYAGFANVGLYVLFTGGALAALFALSRRFMALAA
ncbi:MAG: ABC transporter permease [Anaerolineae bacterium]|nr:ABC transporter permease [Anaerolineae bacterium]